jgi:hypothetical protein
LITVQKALLPLSFFSVIAFGVEPEILVRPPSNLARAYLLSFKFVWTAELRRRMGEDILRQI